jgi:hypothetical protein
VTRRLAAGGFFLRCVAWGSEKGVYVVCKTGSEKLRADLKKSRFWDRRRRRRRRAEKNSRLFKKRVRNVP